MAKLADFGECAEFSHSLSSVRPLEHEAIASHRNVWYTLARKGFAGDIQVRGGIRHVSFALGCLLIICCANGTRALAAEWMDGNRLLYFCLYENRYCEGFIMGVYLQAKGSKDVCDLPEDITEGDLRLTVSHSIEATPHEYRTRAAAGHVLGAIESTYCDSDGEN